MGGLSVVILTYNEALHIERAIESARAVADDILVVDSFSTDDTVRRAQVLGARVLQHTWTNHAAQMNWVLEHGEIKGAWVMRLDADECLDDTLIAQLKPTLTDAAPEVGGFEVNRRIRFMGREIRHGGMAPMWVLRVWRNGWAQCESRWMDEHMVLVRGRIARLSGAIIDDNRNTLTWWVQKHNVYASREALDLLDRRHRLGLVREPSCGLTRQAASKRWVKTRLYTRLPLGLRSWLYFFYRIVLRLGVLDGASGVVFHTLQGLWYRLLVDAKVLEVEQMMQRSACSPRDAIRRVLDIDVDEAQRAPSPHSTQK